MDHKKFNWKKFIKWAGTIVSATLFVWLLTRLDWTEAWNILRDMPFYSYALAVCFLILGQFLNSLRWFVLLRAQDVEISLPQTFKIFMGGVFASNFLPSTIGGDGLRLLAIARISKDQSLGFASVILDRLINILATFTLIPFSISVLRTPGLQINTKIFTFAGVGFCDSKIVAWFRRMVNKYINLFKRWLEKPGFLLLAFVIAWCSSVIILGAVWTLAVGIGIQISIWQVIGISTVSYFITLLPISISGYGLREITYTSLYTLLGASLEQATALTLITRILSTSITLPGVIWMREIISASKKEKGSSL